jgi:hypothetical protein
MSADTWQHYFWGAARDYIPGEDLRNVHLAGETPAEGGKIIASLFSPLERSYVSAQRFEILRAAEPYPT